MKAFNPSFDSILKTALPVLAIALSLVFSAAVQAQPIIPAPPASSAKAYLLIDADSGKVIMEQNADMPLPPASLTKLMTSYVLSYGLHWGELSKSDEVVVSKNAWAQNPVFRGSSLMWIEVGKKVSVADLHRGIAVSSGNDASVAIAEHMAGSEEAFADIMNQHAAMLGMSQSNFVNAHGLHDDNQYTTARDLATLSKAIMQFPESYALYSEKEFTYNNITTRNRNGLLWKDSSVDGLKTGHTKAAGYCLVASAKRNGMRLIAVVMGTDSERAREREVQKMLSYGFRYFETKPLYSAGESLANAKVWKGDAETVQLGLAEDVVITLPRGRGRDLNTELVFEKDQIAPIAAKRPYGELKISLDGETLYRGPLVALNAVEEGGLFKRLWDSLLLFIYNLIS